MSVALEMFLNKMKEDPEFNKAVLAANDKDKIQVIAKQNGIDISLEEVLKTRDLIVSSMVRRAQRSEGKLSDDEMDNVAGGIMIGGGGSNSIMGGIADFGVLAFQGVSDVAVDAANDVADAFGSLWDTTFDTTVGLCIDIADSPIGGVLTDFSDGVHDVQNAVINTILDPSEAAQDISAAINDSPVGDVLDTIADGVHDAVDTVVDVAQDVGEAISDFFSGW